jgi:hypothetical protein
MMSAHPSAEEARPKASLVLNGELFAVDMQIFAARSLPFLRSITAGHSEFAVKPAVNHQSLRTFILAVHKQSCTLTREEALDFADLCEEFQIAKLKQAAVDFISQQPNFTIDLLDRAVQRGFDTSPYESEIRSRVAGLPVDRLLQLPVAVMARVVDFGGGYDDEKFGKVFDLSMSYLERHPHAGSVLFRGLDIMRLSRGQRERLFSCESFG